MIHQNYHFDNFYTAYKMQSGSKKLQIMPKEIFEMAFPAFFYSSPYETDGEKAMDAIASLVEIGEILKGCGGDFKKLLGSMQSKN